MHGTVPYLPQRIVFGAEAPEGEGLEAEGAGHAHLVECGDGVEEPHLVTNVRVFVDVGEVRIE